MKTLIETNNAPVAIGNYSPGVAIGNLVFLSGQIPLDPQTMNLVSGDINEQVTQVFENLKAMATASGGNLNHVVKLTVYLMSLSHIGVVNDAIHKYFKK